MSKADIYRNQDAVRPISTSRRESKIHDGKSSFEKGSKNGKRKRRSRNSGWRRLVHLYRRDRVQKRVWIGVFIFFILILVVAAVVEFGIQQKYKMQDQSEEKLSE